MHLQTGSSSSTTTTTMTSAIPLPASPTLTNPDMILPYGEYDPSQTRKYPSDTAGEDWDDMHFSIGPPGAQIAHMTPTTPIIYGNGTMLSDIGEVTEAESTPVGRSKMPGPAERRLLKQQQTHQYQNQHQKSGQNTPLGSSPTIGYAAVMKRAKTGTHQRQISIESTSTVTSEGQTAEIFKDFDDDVSVDDSVFQGDDEESVADSYTEQVIASETLRLANRDHQDGQEDDRNSSAALSRRAEQILSNAKMRLNNMEGNLTRARSSLYTTPTGSSLSSMHSSSPLSRSTPSPLDETPGTALGILASKQRQLHYSGESPASTSRHARVGSENSALSPQRMAPFPIPLPVRSASAAARYVRPDMRKRTTPSIQAPESPREDARAMSHSGYSPSLNKNSPPHAILEPLDEDDIPDFEADRASIRSSVDGYLTPNGEHRLTRSASSMQMRDLKDQMSDLKGRLSVLRDRARDDTMKRRSMQSLRTPSPFTAAEQWYAASKNYGEPLSADAGLASPPWKGSVNGDEEEPPQETFHAITTDEPAYEESDVTSIYEDVNEHNYATDEDTANPDHRNLEEAEDYDTAQDDQKQAGETFEDNYDEEMVDREEIDDFGNESDATQYHDTLTTPISHEDREDAFDYEHFFLHSAMGTISQQRMQRRGSTGSFSSEDSVETVQGPSAPSKNAEKRGSLGHFRSESTNSVSTVGTFQTATEGRGSDSGDEDEERDTFAVQEVVPLPTRSHTATPITAKRSTFGTDAKNSPDEIHSSADRPRSSSTGNHHTLRNGTIAHRPSIGSVNSFESFGSNGTTRSFPLVNKPKLNTASTPNLRASLLGDSMTLTHSPNGEPLQQSPVDMLGRDDQILVERLVASLGKCVLGLQESGRASYENRVFRRRLEAARRLLEGEGGQHAS